MTFSGTSRRRALKLGLAASLAVPAVARAEAWPSGPIVFLNPFPAGGSTDTFCRPLAAQVGDQLGQQIIVDNKGGAGEKWQKVGAAADVRID
jgi:tripartite-type tricarboxylate transporter receptor subunit TctC